MPRVQFTTHLRMHVPADNLQAEGDSVFSVLEDLFSRYPTVKGFILDDQGALRKHVAIFLDGRSIQDRSRLSDLVRPDSEIFVMQALSGG